MSYLYVSDEIVNILKEVGERIIECDNSVALSFAKKHRINSITLPNDGMPCIGYLMKGSVSVFNASTGNKIATIQAPYIFGLPLNNKNLITEFYRTDEYCELYVISSDDAISVFNLYDLWKQVSLILAYFIKEFFLRNIRLTENNIVCMVCESLRMIFELDKGEREKISIYSFIMNRYSVSRGSIYKVVSYLEKIRAIEIKRGKLIRFNNECVSMIEMIERSSD